MIVYIGLVLGLALGILVAIVAGRRQDVAAVENNNS
jgi:hypothetical protein